MSPSLRGGVIASLLVASLLAAGCTVKPLLATDSGPGAASPGVASELASIAIAPVDTRYAQQVRNHLSFLFTGGAARPSAPRYTLVLTMTQYKSSAATIQVANEEEPTAQLMTLRADYVLRENATGTTVATGKREITASFDVPRQEYAVVRAEIDAENRAARELAELLRLSIGQDLARRGVQG